MSYFESSILWEIEFDTKDQPLKSQKKSTLNRWEESCLRLAKRCEETAKSAKECKKQMTDVNSSINVLQDIVEKFKSLLDDFDTPKP